jgi:hypothetical protein
MISRLTALAATFAVLSTAGLALAAEARQHAATTQVSGAGSTPVVTLPRVEVIGKRLARR